MDVNIKQNDYKTNYEIVQGSTDLEIKFDNCKA
jgi:hypothetical protein